MKHVLRKRTSAVTAVPWLTPAALVCATVGTLHVFRAGSDYGTGSYSFPINK